METYPNLQISREMETKNHGRGSSYPSHSAALCLERDVWSLGTHCVHSEEVMSENASPVCRRTLEWKREPHRHRIS